MKCGDRLHLINGQDLEAGMDDGLGAPGAATAEESSQADQIAWSRIADGHLSPTRPPDVDADDAQADKRNPWFRTGAKDQITGRNVHHLGKADQQLRQSGARIVPDVFCQAANNATGSRVPSL